MTSVQIFWQEMNDATEEHIIEFSEDRILEGYPATVTYEDCKWRVWLTGVGSISSDWNEDDAIQEAIDILHKKIIRKSDILYVERIGQKHDPKQKFYIATLKVMLLEEGRKVLIRRMDYRCGEFIHICKFPDNLVASQ